MGEFTPPYLRGGLLLQEINTFSTLFFRKIIEYI
jgi:hypothetical protein